MTEAVETAANEESATWSAKEVESVVTSIMNYDEIVQASSKRDSASPKVKSSRRKRKRRNRLL